MHCLPQLSGGASIGQPDFGLFTASQCQRGRAPAGRVARAGRRRGQGAGRGSTCYTAGTQQVAKYWGCFRLVLVTYYREFLLVGEDGSGQTARLESFVLAPDAASFWQNCGTSRQIGQGRRPPLHRLPDARARAQDIPGRAEGRCLACSPSFARDALGIVDGFADPSVYVLDPCCSTGAYLVEALTPIERTLDDHGLGALKGRRARQAALSRIRGFETMPAPFVVAHLLIGLFLPGPAGSARGGRLRQRVSHQRADRPARHARTPDAPAFPEFSV